MPHLLLDQSWSTWSLALSLRSQFFPEGAVIVSSRLTGGLVDDTLWRRSAWEHSQDLMSNLNTNGNAPDAVSPRFVEPQRDSIPPMCCTPTYYNRRLQFSVLSTLLQPQTAKIPMCGRASMQHLSRVKGSLGYLQLPSIMQVRSGR